jgi:hypothetical protein
MNNFQASQPEKSHPLLYQIKKSQGKELIVDEPSAEMNIHINTHTEFSHPQSDSLLHFVPLLGDRIAFFPVLFPRFCIGLRQAQSLHSLAFQQLCFRACRTSHRLFPHSDKLDASSAHFAGDVLSQFFSLNVSLINPSPLYSFFSSAPMRSNIAGFSPLNLPSFSAKSQ